MYFVYIVECSDGSLYVGCTNDLEKRVKQHNESKWGAHYTKIRRPVELKYSETFDNLKDARKRESEIKGWDRQKKLNLIQKRIYAKHKTWYNSTMETLKKKSMFWDVSDIDIDKNEKFIIDRILNFGDTDDFQWAIRIYGAEKLKKGILESKTLTGKSLSFWCQYFNINPLQCISKLSKKTQSAFSRR